MLLSGSIWKQFILELYSQGIRYNFHIIITFSFLPTFFHIYFSLPSIIALIKCNRHWHHLLTNWHTNKQENKQVCRVDAIDYHNTFSESAPPPPVCCYIEHITSTTNLTSLTWLFPYVSVFKGSELFYSWTLNLPKQLLIVNYNNITFHDMLLCFSKTAVKLNT